MSAGVSKAAVAFLTLTAVGGIATLLIADSQITTYNLLYTALSLVTFALPAAAGISIVGRFPLAWLGWLTAAVAIVGFGITMGSTWTPIDVDSGQGLTKASSSLFAWSLALGVACLVLTRGGFRDNRLRRVLGVLGVTMILVSAALITIGIVAEIEGELYYRVMAVVAVLAIWSLALLPVVRPRRAPA